MKHIKTFIKECISEVIIENKTRNILTKKERFLINNKFENIGLNKDKIFRKPEHGFQLAAMALWDLGFQIETATLDLLMGASGNRKFNFYRKKLEGQTPFNNLPEISNSQIIFQWESLYAPTHLFPSGEKYKILAYAS
ncbi:MAG TPA: hypothetical protein PLC59_00435 [Bacteroidales bacterium]|jgi:hypothetical protein|nr:hypothetical protein [Bacteroidales bacterium]HQI44531.1 hypothetical protein [Bacteroidales bacterium]